MRFFLSLSALVSTSLLATAPAFSQTTDWSQPPLMCAEDVIPKVPDRPCLDLSTVVNPSKDMPEGLPQTELDYWNSQKFGLQYCRAQEVLKREAAVPGSMTPGAIEISWMRMSSTENRDEKVNAIYDAAETYRIPPHILTGAIYQESIFSELGVADDGGNFSCGVAQINLTEWCQWANAQSSQKKTEMGWPQQAIDCSTTAQKTLIAPFYKIALQRLGNLPSYRLQRSHFENIKYDQVVDDFPSGSSSTQKLRYQIATSFLNSCMTPTNAIMAKANELRSLYDNFVPAGMKKSENYTGKDEFNLQCARHIPSKLYPVHTGWLLAVGSYNAGPRAVDLMASTHKWTRKDVADPSTFKNFTPQDLVASIYKAGVYNPKTKKVEAPDLSGKTMNWNWFKMCILQRHMARVVQHTTIPGIPAIVQNLEGAAGCKQAQTDPERGN